VRGVEIPKPGGGTRQLGIPTVVDRLVQQAILQVLEPLLDPTFSPSSFGFRPGRSAHRALAQAQTDVADGREIVVDLDLETFFDRVNRRILDVDARDKRGHDESRTTQVGQVGIINQSIPKAAATDRRRRCRNGGRSRDRLGGNRTEAAQSPFTAPPQGVRSPGPRSA
jgi:reverse transcriptase-like protein